MSKCQNMMFSPDVTPSGAIKPQIYRILCSTQTPKYSLKIPEQEFKLQRRKIAPNGWGCGEQAVELHWFKLSVRDEHRFMNNSLWGCVEQRSRRGAINTQCVTCINNGIFYFKNKINKPVSNSAEIPTRAWLFFGFMKRFPEDFVLLWEMQKVK